MEQIYPALLVILVGVFTILGAILDWRIVTSPNKLLPRLLGPSLTKPVMAVLGVGVVLLGFALLFGWV